MSDQDRPAVYVQVFDAGCNATDADANLVGYQRHLVKDVRWTVSMGSKVPGSVVENPHIFEVRPWFTQRFTQTDSIEPAYPAVLATAGDNDVRTDGAGDWIRRIATLTAPAARFFHSLAYDSKREVVVVFGGANTGNLLNDLWEFGQGEWQNIAPIDPEGDGNPIARQQAAMAYDSVRGKTVLFGGIWGNSAQLLDDTWEWDGVSWALVPQADPEGDGQPEPRRLHSMAFDQGRGVTVMMGGFQGSNSGPDQVFLNDTWEFNGRSWRLAGEFPGQTPKLTSRKMVYHKGRQTVIYDSSDYATHNLWEWDGENWTMLVEIDLLEDGSPTHYPGSMAYDPLLDRLLFFGGGHGAGKATNTIWAWKDHDWSPVQPHGYPEGPDVAEYAGWVYVPAVDRFLCFGGAAGSMDVPPGTLRGDTWLWDRQNWEEWTVQQPAALPPGLTNSAFQYDENEEVCWLAQGAAQTLQNSTYSWDGVRWRKHDDEFGNVPFAGYSRGDCFNRSAGQMYLLDRPETVGSGSSNMALLQRLDQDGWHTSIPTDPEGDGNPYAPIYCDIGCDEMDGQAILFGGSAQPWGTTIYYYDYTWRWTGTSWAKVVPLDLEGDGNPSARIVHSMTWDPTRNALMLLGGSDEFGKPAPSWKYNGPQWEWDGTSWLKVSAADPEGDGGPADTALEDHSTPYQTATDWDRERVMAVAHSGKQLMSLWEWNGESWVLRTAADPTGDGSPVSRSSPGLTYDTGRHRLVMYGGTIPPSSRIDELWEYDAGVSQRPGHVLRFATAEAGLADGDQLQGLSATWIAGATGDMNGMDGPGVDLRLWENGMWVNIGSDDAASADSPATLTWNEGDVDRIAWLPQGNAGWVGLAVTPKHVNGIDYATLVSDYVEVTVSYRKQ